MAEFLTEQRMVCLVGALEKYGAPREELANRVKVMFLNWLHEEAKP
jgi:hypothetical protein